MFLDNCSQCIYNIDCPCGYSLHNAACLTIASNVIQDILKEYIKYYEKLITIVNDEESSKC